MTESLSSPNISGMDTAVHMFAASDADVFTCDCVVARIHRHTLIIDHVRTSGRWLLSTENGYILPSVFLSVVYNNNNNNDRLTAFDLGQPG